MTVIRNAWVRQGPAPIQNIAVNGIAFENGVCYNPQRFREKV
jgi:hypothetical protein